LATVYRAENSDQPQRLEGIVTALVGLAKGGHRVVFPVHPRTQELLSMHAFDLYEGVIQIDPVSYLDMVLLESMARLILTDSGGIQKEAYWLQVPCLTTLRDETEWEKTVQSGWNRLVGTDSQRISRAVEEAGPGSRTGGSWKKGEASRNVARLIGECRPD
jgi:UDP-GlcNAc3NAcA epimerase